VLIVEDEYLIAMNLVHLLSAHDWRVLGPAATVAESLGILHIERPDVAILDISLRGRELVTPVAHCLRGLNIPFVIASAHRARDFEGAEVLAEAPQLSKPTDERRLLVILQQLTSGSPAPAD
jgi:two-component SAPR family response regulator